MPEVLLNVGKCFSTRLRAPNTGSIDIATYYMSNYTCEFARSVLERAIEGGYQYLDVLAEVDACSAMNRCAEHIEVLNCNTKPDFFCTHLDVPYKVEDYSVEHMAIQVRLRLLDEFKNVYGVDVSDDAIRAAVKEHNELCDVITELSELRKLENAPITGYEFAICTLVSYVCPTALILPYLKETLEEVKARELDPKPWYRARVASSVPRSMTPSSSNSSKSVAHSLLPTVTATARTRAASASSSTMRKTSFIRSAAITCRRPSAPAT